MAGHTFAVDKNFGLTDSIEKLSTFVSKNDFQNAQKTIKAYEKYDGENVLFQAMRMIVDRHFERFADCATGYSKFLNILKIGVPELLKMKNLIQDEKVATYYEHYLSVIADALSSVTYFSRFSNGCHAIVTDVWDILLPLEKDEKRIHDCLIDLLSRSILNYVSVPEGSLINDNEKIEFLCQNESIFTNGRSGSDSLMSLSSLLSKYAVVSREFCEKPEEILGGIIKASFAHLAKYKLLELSNDKNKEKELQSIRLVLNGYISKAEDLSHQIVLYWDNVKENELMIRRYQNLHLCMSYQWLKLEIAKINYNGNELLKEGSVILEAMSEPWTFYSPHTITHLRRDLFFECFKNNPSEMVEKFSDEILNSFKNPDDVSDKPNCLQRLFSVLKRNDCKNISNKISKWIEMEAKKISNVKNLENKKTSEELFLSSKDISEEEKNILNFILRPFEDWTCPLGRSLFIKQLWRSLSEENKNDEIKKSFILIASDLLMKYLKMNNKSSDLNFNFGHFLVLFKEISEGNKNSEIIKNSIERIENPIVEKILQIKNNQPLSKAILDSQEIAEMVNKILFCERLRQSLSQFSTHEKINELINSLLIELTDRSQNERNTKFINLFSDKILDPLILMMANIFLRRKDISENSSLKVSSETVLFYDRCVLLSNFLDNYLKSVIAMREDSNKNAPVGKQIAQKVPNSLFLFWVLQGIVGSKQKFCEAKEGLSIEKLQNVTTSWLQNSFASKWRVGEMINDYISEMTIRRDVGTVSSFKMFSESLNKCLFPSLWEVVHNYKMKQEINSGINYANLVSNYLKSNEVVNKKDKKNDNIDDLDLLSLTKSYPVFSFDDFSYLTSHAGPVLPEVKNSVQRNPFENMKPQTWGWLNPEQKNSIKKRNISDDIVNSLKKSSGGLGRLLLFTLLSPLTTAIPKLFPEEELECQKSNFNFKNILKNVTVEEIQKRISTNEFNLSIPERFQLLSSVIPFLAKKTKNSKNSKCEEIESWLKTKMSDLRSCIGKLSASSTESCSEFPILSKGDF